MACLIYRRTGSCFIFFMNDMLTSKLIKSAAMTILALILGVVLAIYSKSWAMLGAGFLVAAYFAVDLVSAIQNSKKNKYTKVTAMAVASDESKSGLSVIETWRFIPVDEDGNYINQNGKFDIFLQVKQKDRSYHIGATYNMLFCAEPGEALTQDNLVSIERKKVQAQAQVQAPTETDAHVETKAETKKEAPNVKVITVVKGGKAPRLSKAPDSADENGSEVEGDEV